MIPFSLTASLLPAAQLMNRFYRFDALSLYE
jgi:hypothetical protein